MKTKKEILKGILDYLNSSKEKYQNNLHRYNEILDNLSHDSNDYKTYYMLRELDKTLLDIVNDEIDYFNKKED